MNATLLRSSFLASFTTLCASVPAAGSGTPVACADSGHCHFARWEPGAVPNNARAGAATAISDGYAAVGVPGADQVILYREIDGVWDHFQTLNSPGGSDSEFGFTLDMFDDQLIVGSPEDDHNGSHTGSASYYKRENGEYQFVETVGSPFPETGSRFGHVARISDNWSAIGQPSGAVGGRFVTFERSGDNWLSSHSSQRPGAPGFGFALDVWGTDLVVGDWSNSLYGNNAGLAYYYSLSSESLAGPRVIEPSSHSPGARFGTSIALDNSRLAVGAETDGSLVPGGGSAYVFERVSSAGSPPATYEQLQRFLPCTIQPGANFGRHVAIHMGRIAVSAPKDVTGTGNAGKVYTFARNDVFGEVWSIEDQISPADGQINDAFGSAVAVSGRRVLVGAHGSNSNERGSAYFVTLNRDTYGGGHCPCDIEAGESTSGVGKPGIQGVPQIDVTSLVIPAEQTVVKVSNLPVGAAPFLVWGVEPAAIPLDGGTLHMQDPHLIALPVATAFGQVGMGFAIQPSPEICGVELIIQAFVIEPPVGSESLVSQSAAYLSRVGY